MNQLTELPKSIGSLTSLQRLYLNNNQLAELPDTIGFLSQLQSLDLSKNKLTELPESLLLLNELRDLDLSYNLLNPDLAAAYEHGIDAVKQYLRAKAEGEVILNEAKLIVVGEGEVGKSCLLGALRGDQWVEGRPTTHGIEIKPVVVTAPDGKTQITLNGWDFGGQQVYRPTHQLFFSSSAVYLVVWKPREGPQQGFVKEWITLIQRQDTHLDSLAERLREDRVRAIIEPILSGQELGNIPQDDIRFVLDLGLCVMDRRGGLAIANPIYREVLPRVLAFTPMASLPQIAPTWLHADGTLDTEALLNAFLAFWKRHGEPLLKSAPYHEIAPHLVMMAFLHRVVNGEGTLEREYAIGRDRMDLCLQYGEVTLGIELKVQRDKGPNQLKAGLEQIEGYLERLSLNNGWLVIFDRRQDAAPISDRTHIEHHQSPKGLDITVIFG